MSNLKEEVIKQLGYETNYSFNEFLTKYNDDEFEELKGTLSDIANHGIDGGFGDFIYYSDTVKFFDDNKDLIIEHLREQADQFGVSMWEMVNDFKCMNDIVINDSSEIDSHEYSTTIKNCLAWYAAEEVARELTQ